MIYPKVIPSPPPSPTRGEGAPACRLQQPFSMVWQNRGHKETPSPLVGEGGGEGAENHYAFSTTKSNTFYPASQ